MTDEIAVVRRLYEAFRAQDADAILAVLHPAFQGDVSEGMPLGVGGHHDGPEAMLREVWAPIFEAYDVRVDAEDLVGSGDRVIAVGTYRGIERATGAPFEAIFAHVLSIRDGQIRSLQQITDTCSWPG
jgi:ketosteroid isomerase-like protein